MRINEIPAIILLAGMLLSAFILLPALPDKVPMHWNAQGQVDKYGDPWTIFITPIITLAIYGVFLLIPIIAVEKKNIQLFYKKHGTGFKLVFILFMLGIYIITIMASFGQAVDINLVVMALLGGLFFYLGHIMRTVKRNYFIGFRTPWALADDKVWKKTNEAGGLAFMALGIVTAVFGILGLPIMWFVLLSIALVLLIFVYSYLEFRKRRR